MLDFVGTHRKEFRFDRRYRALLGGTRRDVERAVEMQFPFLPAGCNMQLDEKAAEVVLRSLREAIPSRWKAKVDELRSLRRERPDLGLAEFMDESGLDLDDIYASSRELVRPRRGCRGRQSWPPARRTCSSASHRAAPPRR